jgi:hypothetical protein
MASQVSGMLSEALHPVLQDEMIGPGLVRGFGTVLPLITQIKKAHVLMLEYRFGMRTTSLVRSSGLLQTSG